MCKNQIESGVKEIDIFSSEMLKKCKFILCNLPHWLLWQHQAKVGSCTYLADGLHKPSATYARTCMYMHITVINTMVQTEFLCPFFFQIYKIWTISILDTKFETKKRRNERNISMHKIIILVKNLSKS